MKTELTDVSSTQKEIKIEIDAATVKTAYNKVSQKYAHAANVPGFRKGNAPLDVVRVRFRDEINNEVLQEIIPKAVSEAVEEHEGSSMGEGVKPGITPTALVVRARGCTGRVCGSDARGVRAGACRLRSVPVN